MVPRISVGLQQLFRPLSSVTGKYYTRYIYIILYIICIFLHERCGECCGWVGFKEREKARCICGVKTVAFSVQLFMFTWYSVPGTTDSYPTVCNIYIYIYLVYYIYIYMCMDVVEFSLDLLAFLLGARWAAPAPSLPPFFFFFCFGCVQGFSSSALQYPYCFSNNIQYRRISGQ